jgi:hypothetical protein
MNTPSTSRTPPQQQESLIVDQLLQNKDPISRLTLTRSINYCVRERFEELLHAVEKNETITTLYLGPYFYSSLTDDQRSIFCETVGRECKKLQVWTITTLDLTKACFSGNAMGRALGQSSMLQTLRIERTLLMEDVNMLAAGFNHHPTLRHVTLPRLSLQPVNVNVKDRCYRQEGSDIDITTADTGTGANNNTGILDPLLVALRTIPHLEAVQLGLDPLWRNASASSSASGSGASKTRTSSAVSYAMVVSPAALAILAPHPILAWLVIARFQLQDAHVQAFATALTNEPDSHLKDLDLSANNNGNNDENPVCLITQASWQAVADMLERNTRLEMVRLPSSQSSSSGAATVEVETSKALVRLYLRLNRKGRGRLWSSMEDSSSMTVSSTSSSSATSSPTACSIDDWWPVLADLSDDLNAIWILLRGSPMVCVYGAGSRR